MVINFDLNFKLNKFNSPMVSQDQFYLKCSIKIY